MPLLVVAGDPVSGTDTHNAQGQATDSASGALVPWTGTGRYRYTGAMRTDLSTFVRISGAAAAVTSSASALDPGENVPPVGGHSGPAGSAITPGPGQPATAPTPVPLSLTITDSIGTGIPGSAAGSGFVRISGDPVLVDQDPIDTCDANNSPGNSTVTASTQNFVTSSA